MIKQTNKYDKNLYTDITTNVSLDKDTLFFDIETTGFSPKSAVCYLIGCLHMSDDKIILDQWLAEKPDDEKDILKTFFEVTCNYSKLVNYNGTTFDLPFLRERALRYKIKYNLDNMENIDIYKSVIKSKKLLGLSSLKQKDIEHFLKIERKDKYTGGELIDVFKHFITSKDNDDLGDLLLLHNHDDVFGLFEIYPVVNYVKLKEPVITDASYTLEDFESFEGIVQKRLQINAVLDSSVPKRLTLTNEFYYVIVEGNKIKVSITGISGTMKFFFKDYKDYYYLPDEDVAMHKSVASYVDKNHRKQATAATCYTKKAACFFPQPEKNITPAFQEDYGSYPYYFEINEKTILNFEQLNDLIKDIMRTI